MGEIIHGNKNCGFAQIVEDGGVYSFGTPVMIPGLVNFTIEVEQEDTIVYADDTQYCRVKGAKVRNATATFRKIPASYAAYLGFFKNKNGMLTDSGEFASHCIFFETTEEDCSTGIVTPTLHYLYNVKGSEPTWESSTDEEEVEVAEFSVDYTASESDFVFDDNGKKLQYGYITRTEENAVLYDAFRSSIIKPTDVISN